MNGLSGPLKLVALLALIVAAVSIACGQEVTAPVPASETSQTVPAVPADTPVRAAPAALPPAEPGHFGGFNLSPIAQMETTENEVKNKAAEGKITVSANGSATLAADDAYVVIVPEHNYGVPSQEQLSEDDRDDIVEKLVELGVAEEAIEFDYQGRFGQIGISVKLAPSEIADLSQDILDAVEEVIRRFEDYGLRFTLSGENCDRALAEARRDAVPNAAKSADDLAQALGMARGAVVGATENPTANHALRLVGLDDADVCSGQSDGPYHGLLPFDAEAEVEISVDLEVTYLMEPADMDPPDTQPTDPQ